MYECETPLSGVLFTYHTTYINKLRICELKAYSQYNLASYFGLIRGGTLFGPEDSADKPTTVGGSPMMHVHGGHGCYVSKDRFWQVDLQDSFFIETFLMGSR